MYDSNYKFLAPMSLPIQAKPKMKQTTFNTTQSYQIYILKFGLLHRPKVVSRLLAITKAKWTEVYDNEASHSYSKSLG